MIDQQSKLFFPLIVDHNMVNVGTHMIANYTNSKKNNIHVELQQVEHGKINE